MRTRRIIRWACGPILIAALFLGDMPGNAQKDPGGISPSQSTTGPLPPAGVDRTGQVFSASGAAAATVISGVPSYLWRYGCGPTALGMVVGFYDSRGYPSLIPGDANSQGSNVNTAIASQGNYDDYCLPIDYSPNLLPDKSELPLGDEHADNCLADFMKSSQSHYYNYYGWSWNYHVQPSFENYTAWVSNYSGISSMSSFSGFPWSRVQEEINNNRPLVFLVDSDGNGSTDHFVTVIGYNTQASVNYYGCYDTWDSNVHWYEYRALANGSPWGVYSINTFGIATSPVSLAKHGVGDFDGDSAAEAAFDFGAAGVWMWNNGTWTQLTSSNPNHLVAADLDGDNTDELIADLGAGGLWRWKAGAWGQLSALVPDSIISADVDGGADDEVVADFGPSGLWLWNGGAWTQLSGASPDMVIALDSDGDGYDEVAGDFGSLGLWAWNGGGWSQVSGANADGLVSGNVDATGGEEIVADMGSLGVWVWVAGVWNQISGGNAENIGAGDCDGDGSDEVAGDFSTTGLWLWNGGALTVLSSANCDFMRFADVDGDGAAELVGDFSSLGLWLWNGGAWAQLSGGNPDYIIIADADGDAAGEIIGDFGTLGVWLWNSGAWSQISSADPE